jgi:PEP-CTERM motif
MIKRVIFAAALALSVASPALAASILYGTDNASTFKVNTATGVATLLGSNGLGGFDADGYGSILRDLTASSSQLYGAQWNVSSTGITGAVATVNSVTGAVTSSIALTGLIETGFNQGLYSVAYDLSTNTLYGNTARRLYTIDQTTGATTFVGDLGPGSIVGLAIDGTTGTLYSISQIVDAASVVTTLIKTLDKTNASVLSTVTLANQCACDIAFDPLTGKGYVASTFNDAAGAFSYAGLDLLDSTATSTTFIGQHGPAGPFGMSGLAFLGATAPVPEPATWAMMIAGFGVAGVSLRRSKRAFATAAI